MKFKPTSGTHPSPRAEGRRAFTLAEVLAALVFMAIVIPVAIEGIRVAGRAGQLAERKAEAARVAERILNEIIVTGQASQSGLNGVAREGIHEYPWRLLGEPWEMDALRVLRIQVTYFVQGQEQDVRLSTLWDANAAPSLGEAATR